MCTYILGCSFINSFMTEAAIIQKPVGGVNQWTGFYMITASVMKELKLKGEMYEGKEYPLENNLKSFLKEFAYVFLPLKIFVLKKSTKMYVFLTYPRNGTFSVDIWKLQRIK